MQGWGTSEPQNDIGNEARSGQAAVLGTPRIHSNARRALADPVECDSSLR